MRILALVGGLILCSVAPVLAGPPAIVPPPAVALEACQATLEAMRTSNALMSQDWTQDRDQNVLRRAILTNRVKDLEAKVKELQDKLDAAKTEVKPKP